MAIPQTRTRLKGYVSLYAQEVDLADIELDPLTLDGLQLVGAAQSCVINQTREGNSVRREFNPALSGKASETVPGLPSYEVTLKRIDLYDANFLESMGVDGVNIVKQIKPLVIVVKQPVPVDKAGNPLTIKGRAFKERGYIIPGCWLKNLPLDFDIDSTDQSFIALVNLDVRDVISY